jgi:hypothetical protein
MGKGLFASLVAVAAMIVVCAGCGGGDNGGSTTAATATASPTKAAFIKKADALCAKGNTRINLEIEKFAAESKSGTAGSARAQEEAMLSQVLAPGIGRQADEIASLSAPKGDEEEIEAIVGAIEAGAAKGEKDPSSITVLESKPGAFSEASKLARAYGLQVCGGE